MNENEYWDNDKKLLYSFNKIVKLSNSEVKIFNLLINNTHQIFSKYDLLNLIQEDYYDDISDDSIKSVIKRLRKKISIDIIKNVYGLGYKLEI